MEIKKNLTKSSSTKTVCLRVMESTQCDSVINVISQMRIFRPRFNVVGFQLFYRTTDRTSPSISVQHLSAPTFELKSGPQPLVKFSNATLPLWMFRSFQAISRLASLSIAVTGAKVLDAIPFQYFRNTFLKCLSASKTLLFLKSARLPLLITSPRTIFSSDSSGMHKFNLAPRTNSPRFRVFFPVVIMAGYILDRVIRVVTTVRNLFTATTRTKHNPNYITIGIV